MNRTLEELRDFLGFILNHNDGQTDQDFTEARLNDALNHAYREEIRIAQLEGNKNFFKKQQSITWPDGDLTYKLPQNIQSMNIIRMQDITNDDPGEVLSFSENGEGSELFWKDNQTLQWGSAGPNEDKTIRIFYLAVPEKLKRDRDEPDLIPPANRDLLCWSAAVFLRIIAEDEAPASFKHMLNMHRMDFIKIVSKGRPHDHEPWISPRDSDHTEEVFN